MISLKVSCLGHFISIPDSKVHVEVPVLHMVYCPLYSDAVVSIKTTYNIGCCSCILIQPSIEMNNDNKPIYTHGITIITWVNVVYSLLVHTFLGWQSIMDVIFPKSLLFLRLMLWSIFYLQHICFLGGVRPGLELRGGVLFILRKIA